MQEVGNLHLILIPLVPLCVRLGWPSLLAARRLADPFVVNMVFRNSRIHRHPQRKCIKFHLLKRKQIQRPGFPKKDSGTRSNCSQTTPGFHSGDSLTLSGALAFPCVSDGSGDARTVLDPKLRAVLRGASAIVRTGDSAISLWEGPGQ